MLSTFAQGKRTADTRTPTLYLLIQAFPETDRGERLEREATIYSERKKKKETLHLSVHLHSILSFRTDTSALLDLLSAARCHHLSFSSLDAQSHRGYDARLSQSYLGFSVVR